MVKLHKIKIKKKDAIGQQLYIGDVVFHKVVNKYGIIYLLNEEEYIGCPSNWGYRITQTPRQDLVKIGCEKTNPNLFLSVFVGKISFHQKNIKKWMK